MRSAHVTPVTSRRILAVIECSDAVDVPKCAVSPQLEDAEGPVGTGPRRTMVTVASIVIAERKRWGFRDGRVGCVL